MLDKLIVPVKNPFEQRKGIKVDTHKASTQTVKCLPYRREKEWAKGRGTRKKSIAPRHDQKTSSHASKVAHHGSIS